MKKFLHTLVLSLIAIVLAISHTQPVQAEPPIGEQALVPPPELRVSANSSTSQMIREPFYLQQIHAQAGWNLALQNQNDIVIALIDTGVDLTHPDLQESLVRGVNLLDRKAPPQDDNGHGTNVAGVIAAVANNGSRPKGSVKIMPIKALNARGYGDEETLIEGLRYAIDQGADIVVFSAGLNFFSEELEMTVQLAENKNILLVAAAGNDGKSVKYPAAYPTVLTVGGAKSNGQVHPNSSYGQEMDVIAPWQVYTTELGSRYAFAEGTSMAAPQAAAVAALIKSKYPNMAAYEIRSLICQTAVQTDPEGWNEYSGYGMLRADTALSSIYNPNIFDDNHSMEHAKPLPVDSMITARLQGGKDEQWFTIRPPYDGTVRFTIRSMNDNPVPLQLTHFNKNEKKIYNVLNTPYIDVPVVQGQSFIQLKALNSQIAKPIDYKITTEFMIYHDRYGDNHRMFKAHTLPMRSQEITGSFGRINEEDWFVIPVTQKGTLSIVATTDTPRIDLELSFFRQGDEPLVIDEGGEGELEYLNRHEVKPGRYYIMVRNVIHPVAYPVTGEYKLDIQFVPVE